MEVIESPVKRAKLARERTYRKKMTTAGSMVLPKQEIEFSEHPDFYAKMRNDEEFGQVEETQVNVEIVREFVAKQVVKGTWLREQ